MHKLARQLKVQLPTTRSSAEPILTKAIVVAKIKKLDHNADERYEWSPIELKIDRCHIPPDMVPYHGLLYMSPNQTQTQTKTSPG